MGGYLAPRTPLNPTPTVGLSFLTLTKDSHPLFGGCLRPILPSIFELCHQPCRRCHHVHKCCSWPLHLAGIDMAGAEELVDLSLFATSPTFDGNFTSPDVWEQQYRFQSDAPPLRNFSRPLPRDYSSKPLPPLPRRRMCPTPRISTPKRRDTDSSCIIQKIKRVRSNDQAPTQNTDFNQRRNLTSPTPQLGFSAYQENTLLQRRNLTGPAPQLTLSAPQSNSRGLSTASAMVWMPEEQMWLISGDLHRDVISSHEPDAAPPAYTPAYTPTNFTRSEPSPTIRSQHDLTPPLTPVQVQLERLLEQQRREPLPQPPSLLRDEERLSPLFQEAMNSVPMMDPTDLNAPSLFSDRSGKERPRTANSPALRPQNSNAMDLRSRSLSVGSQAAHSRNISSSSGSFYSAVEDFNDDAKSATRSWTGLARKIARSVSATD